jgi:hypothetical protein
VDIIISLHWLWLVLLVISGLATFYVCVLGFLFVGASLLFWSGIIEFFKALGLAFILLIVSVIFTIIFLVLYLISINAGIVMWLL